MPLNFSAPQSFSPLVPQVCHGKYCTKRTGTVYIGDNKDKSAWLFLHDVNTSDICYTRTEGNYGLESQEVVFDVPDEVPLSSILLPFILSAAFFVAACICIPAYIKPDSRMNKVLEQIGVQRDDTPLLLRSISEDTQRGLKELREMAHDPDGSRAQLSDKH
eukprot:CAMPEP_0184306104 /NCGR_PEP_ID=MMETSP1049-20130417/15185_1 /TAXON_ID=77928 /ORGANISM="Proteomonas sulcata, Strain CCMP704" /LENGTH=160 /DNA_ID=CAMNT_0026618293 /DNA_START=80 /DNA_END=562 /DNA_ORIENTATION=+